MSHPAAVDGSGTAEITVPGVYQCFAGNVVGKAMSNTARVVKAERAQFPENGVLDLPATVGEKLKIDCRTTQLGVPSPTFEQFSWKSKDNDKPWPLDQRVQIDDNGTYLTSG